MKFETQGVANGRGNAVLEPHHRRPRGAQGRMADSGGGRWTYRRQLHQPDAIGKGGLHLVAQGARQPGFAHPARPGQGQAAVDGVLKLVSQVSEFDRTPD